MPYRLIRLRSDGTSEVEVLNSLRNAYVLCKGEDETHWHRMVFPAVLAAFNEQPRAHLRVSWNDAAYPGQPLVINYIQGIESVNDAMPRLAYPGAQAAQPAANAPQPAVNAPQPQPQPQPCVCNHDPRPGPQMIG